MIFPKREKRIPQLPPLPPLEEPEFPRYEPRYEPRIPRLPPLPPLKIAPQIKEPVSEEPIFVKIDQYKNAISTLSDIKAKLKEAEAAINKLNELKEIEDKEMAHWNETMQTIKDRLLSIDKKLFGVK